MNQNSTEMVKIAYDALEEKLAMAGYVHKRMEGNKNSTWILMDYGDVIIHIFSKEDRLFYDLERIWRDGRNVSREELA